MTTKNAILLIVKQNNGIDYNSLLNKFASSYSNVNSARAALSRSLKDLSTFGFLARKGNRYYILEKGESEIYSEIKNKLVISLNETMKQREPEGEVANVVSKLQVLIERSRQDRDLLKTSKSSLDFSVSDLERMGKNLESKISHMKYLQKVFAEQIGSLKELDFNDKHARDASEESAKILGSLLLTFPESEFTVESPSREFIEAAAQKFNARTRIARNNSFAIQKSDVSGFLIFVSQNQALFKGSVVSLYSSATKTRFFGGKIILAGPFSEVDKWRNAQTSASRGVHLPPVGDSLRER
ncbi:MAG: hypothetical protein NUV67_04630 [archaeon]|nr:hypothetical protein [archaeon]